MTALAEDAILIDTDVFSFLMRAGDTRRTIYEPHVKGKRMCVSFVTVGELFYGAYKRKWGQGKLDDMKKRLRSVVVVPFDQQLCHTYADIKSKLTRSGNSVADNDLWIAACAVRHSLQLVSHNRKHFANVPWLALISEAEVVKEIRSQGALWKEEKAPTSGDSSEQEPPSSQ